MAYSCSQRGEKESDRTDAGIDWGRPEDLLQNMHDVPWQRRRRRWTCRDRAQYSPGETFRSKPGKRIGRLALLENHDREKANAGIWEKTFRDRSLEPGKLRPHAFKALRVVRLRRLGRDRG